MGACAAFWQHPRNRAAGVVIEQAAILARLEYFAESGVLMRTAQELMSIAMTDASAVSMEAAAAREGEP